MRTLTYTVPAAYDGDMLQSFLRRECGVSYRLLVRLKRVEGGMLADGQPLRSIDRIRTGQVITLTMPADTVRVEAVPLPLTVAYEDESVLAIDKPPYLAVHPSAGKPEPTLASAVVAHYQQAGEALAFRPLYRLDRNTSGLLLAAKNPHAAYVLAGKTEKSYLAVVCGTLEGTGTIEQPIRVKEGCCITREVGEGGKPSITHWQAVAGDGAVTLLRVRIETGRTHQIRVHMAWCGHPLVGDTMYGTTDEAIGRHALHCAELCFRHPQTGEAVALYSPLPPDMRDLLTVHGIAPDEAVPGMPDGAAI